ncbi:MAG: hypothetical protein K6E50_01410 [Lachnospiraceae bacterium]|nr:hypothetical protein [Lachnospiraceae bacterium]
MEENTNDLPEKKYPESAMAQGTSRPADPNDPTLMAAYAGPEQMNSQPIGFVYAGPAQMSAGPAGMMNVFMNMTPDQQASMMMAYAGPQQIAGGIGIGMMAANAAMASQNSDQGKAYKFCPNCGFAGAETARFCAECGSSLEGVEAKKI